MTHAMLFTGVDVLDGATRKWRVENSWGADKGKDGFYTMNDSWFDEYVFEIAARRDALPEELRAALDTSRSCCPPGIRWARSPASGHRRRGAADDRDQPPGEQLQVGAHPGSGRCGFRRLPGRPGASSFQPGPSPALRSTARRPAPATPRPSCSPPRPPIGVVGPTVLIQEQRGPHHRIGRARQQAAAHSRWPSTRATGTADRSPGPCMASISPRRRRRPWCRANCGSSQA